MKEFGCTTKIMTNHNMQINLFEILKENHVYDALHNKEKSFSSWI